MAHRGQEIRLRVVRLFRHLKSIAQYIIFLFFFTQHISDICTRHDIAVMLFIVWHETRFDYALHPVFVPDTYEERK